MKKNKTFVAAAAVAVLASACGAEPPVDESTGPVAMQSTTSQLPAEAASLPVDKTPTTAPANTITPTTTASVDTTIAPTTTAPADPLELLSDFEVRRMREDTESGEFTNAEIFTRSTARTQIRQAFTLQSQITFECMSDVDACDIADAYGQAFSGEVLQEAVAGLESLKGQGVKVSRPDPDPTEFFVTNIEFTNDTWTEADVSFCGTEHIISTSGGETIVHDPLQQIGLFRYRKHADGVWRVASSDVSVATGTDFTCGPDGFATS